MKKFTIKEFRERYPDDDACLDKIFQLRFSNLVCPKCENDKPFKRVKDRRSYQCRCCGFQVYPTKNTVFEKTTTPLTYWFYAIYLQTTTRNGVAAKELERQLDVCYKTALRMAHQIKILMSDKQNPVFRGVVEIDETYLGGQAKNYSNSKRKKLEQENVKNYNAYGKTPVFGILERGEGGKIYTEVMSAITRAWAEETIKRLVPFGSKVYTDNSQIYAKLHMVYNQGVVNHVDKVYAKGPRHVNTIESFWSMVKRTIRGTHIHVSDKHLQKYLDEIAFRWEHRHDQAGMFETILSRVTSFSGLKPS